MKRTLSVLVFAIVILLSLTAVSLQAGEPDSDADGVLNEIDECVDTLKGHAVDEQGCSVGDNCPCLYPWKNHGEYVSCVTKTSQDFVKAGLISNKVKSDYVSEAADGCELSGLPNYTNYGDPDHPPVKHASDTLEITFAVTGDPQFWDMYEQPLIPTYCGDIAEDRLLASQKTVKEIKAACKSADPECMGVFVAGDLTQTSSVQPIIAFRQLFEYGYPGDDGGSIACRKDDYYHRYSWGYNVGYPMLALIGNHDDPADVDNSEYVQDYLNDLVGGNNLYDFPIEKRTTGTVPSSFFRGNYTWEWGSVNFISLGLWAFHDRWVSSGNTAADPYKIDWLKEYLAAVGHERAIVLFQHYGFDGFSFHHDDDGKYQWWSRDDAELLINVLCNRDSSDEPCGTEEKPRYNVIGIFSGHTHEVGHKTICAEKDTVGDCVVQFDNYVVNDAGPDSNGDGTGYTMVHLNLWPEGYSRHSDVQMTVTNHNLSNLDYAYDFDGTGDGDNQTTYDLVTHSTHTKTGITTGFTTWDQGEPNNYRSENCATFKPNGRFNDLDCSTYLRFVCRELDPSNPLIGDLHLLTAEDAGTWGHGEFICEDSGENRIFSLPKSFEEQLDLMQLIIDSGDSSPVWVNESDQIEEGHWIVYPQDYFYFGPGQPNDGSQIPQDKGHGEDCAVINKDGLLADRRCENEMHNYVCKDNHGWYIHHEKGMWKQAFDEDKCGEHGFKFPVDAHEYHKMYKDVKDNLEEFGIAWISLNDITEEGNWVNATWMQKCWGRGNDSQITQPPSATSRQISAGNDFTCGIQQDGTVKCWGYDAFGRLDPPPGKFLQISAGERHVCGVRSDKTVACWGWNEYDQLNAPTGKFHQVSVGILHSCGMRIDGTLACWGDNLDGQLDAPTGKFRQISAGSFYTCGLDRSNAVQCWGRNDWGQLDVPSNTFRQVSTGELHACGIQKDNNEVLCWGDNNSGQLDAPFGMFLNIDAGYFHTCGIRGTLPQTLLEGYWKLDDGSGMIAADSSANGYDGTLENSPKWSSDTPKTNFDNSKSLRFNRADSDYVKISATTNIDNLAQFSISTWVKLTAMPLDSVMRFVTLGNAKASLRYDGEKGPGQLHFYMKDESGAIYHVRKDNALSTGSWLHVAGTYDGSTMRLYLDGVEQNTMDVSVTVQKGTGMTLSWTDEALDGRLDEVRIYNRALSHTEIQALAAGDQAGSGTLACWGDNTTGQSDAPFDTFDQVNAGGFHTCSIKSFVHPWEDDFAAGQKSNKDEDCAELYTFSEDGQQTGKFYDKSCSHYFDNFACRSVETGDWKIAGYSSLLGGASMMVGGFDYCITQFGNDWRFDSPMTEAGNERLLDAIWDQYGEEVSVALNYSDARIDGLWRHTYWENWYEAPLTGFGRCASLDIEGAWHQEYCDVIHKNYVCDYGYGNNHRYELMGPNTWKDAVSDCADRGAYLPIPLSRSEQDEILDFLRLNSYYKNKIWIHYTDLDHEGHWEDQRYGD